jgi:hypothetical protein
MPGAAWSLFRKLNMDEVQCPLPDHPLRRLPLHSSMQMPSQKDHHRLPVQRFMHEGVKALAWTWVRNSLCRLPPLGWRATGSYRWVKTSRLRDIPRLPEELFQTDPDQAPPREAHTESREPHKEFREGSSLEGWVGARAFGPPCAVCVLVGRHSWMTTRPGSALA